MSFKIKARSLNQEFETQGFSGPSLLEQLQESEVPIKSSCLGKGICRQCRVKVESGIAPVSSSDRKSFNETLLKDGWRLSCCIRPKTAISVFFPQTYLFEERTESFRAPLSDWWYACDLGTTGIEISAVDLKGTIAKVHALNRSVTQGADIMTRLEYAQRNGIEPLYLKTKSQLLKLLSLLENLVKKNAGPYLPVPKVLVSGNSAVTSFLARLDVTHLAVSPYQPATLEAQTFTLDQYTVETLPLLTSFIGGDLFSGLFKLWCLDSKDLSQPGPRFETPWILMDVGTNSEILYWNGEKLVVSSTPAGPAFEGSNISIGMRAESGAIIEPRLNDGKWTFRTVGGDAPRGICGSALVQAIAELVKSGAVSEDGEVKQESALEFSQGLSLSQDDIREFQLAKSAIQTGLELVSSGVKPKTLYLAGAFGQNLPLEESHRLGLIPRVQVETLGNSSLEGTILWGQAESATKAAFQNWLEIVKSPFELALSDQFQEIFVRNMELKS